MDIALAVIIALTVILVVVTLLPITTHPAWWVRGGDFPRIQIASVGVTLMVATAALSPYPFGITLILTGIQFACVAYQLWWIFPYCHLAQKEVPRFKTHKMTATDQLKLLAVNVLQTNRRAADLIKLIHHEQPDFIVAVETDSWWQAQLDQALPDYPHRHACPLDNLYGMVVYAKHPMGSAKTYFRIEDNIPSMRFMLELNSGRQVEVHCVHPAPPSPTENEESTERDAELVMVANDVKNKSHPVIVTGDLNDVAWSRTTRLFRKISGLLDPRVGRGVFNTFHARIPFLRWPLDHVFHSEHFALVALRRLPYFGSDHFPIIIELALLEDALQHTDGLTKTSEDEQLEKEIMARAMP